MSDNPEIQDKENVEERTPFEDFLYHQQRALEETAKALEALLPEGFKTHANNASKEFTDGFRTLIDAAMKELKKAKDTPDDPEKPSTTGKTKVKVDVE